MDAHDFIETLEFIISKLDYSNQDKATQQCINHLLGFYPVLRKGQGLARKLEQTSMVESYAAKAGDYHFRPTGENGLFTSEGWVIDGDVFAKTYEWLDDERVNGWRPCFKRTATWVHETISLDLFDYPAYVTTLEGVQPFKYGDWIAIGVKGELWPIASEKHIDYNRMKI